MKQKFSILLIFTLALSLFTLPVLAVSNNFDMAVQTVQTLGIMNGDEQGNLNLSANVTRSEFAKMMVSASSFKDSIGKNSNISMFSDVPSSHWANEYIKTAVEQGWFIGYLDGSFKPSNPITLEEAMTATLRLLGYNSQNLKGAFPYAQLSKADAIGLSDGILKSQGDILSRQDCVTLFDNLMTSVTAQNTVYGTTLGYKLRTDGNLDFSSLLLTQMKGPFRFDVTSGASLPFSTSNATFYRNDKLSSQKTLYQNEIYYYNENLKKVWVYNSSVSGVYTQASPNLTAPSSITVAGTDYKIESADAAFKLSTLGDFHIGDNVTLLLGMNGEVSDVIDTDFSNTLYGIVTGTGTDSYSNAQGQTSANKYVKLLSADGLERIYYTDYNDYSLGALISVSFENNQYKLNSVSSKSLSGTFNDTATKFENYELSSQIKIVDTDNKGNFKVIYPQRLKNVTLTASNVKYYSLDENNKIDQLILKDVTGDIYEYGYITSAQETSQAMVLQSSYSYISKGISKTVNNTNSVFNATTGGAVFTYADSKISSIKNLKNIEIESISSGIAFKENKKIAISDNVQCYIKNGDSYILSNIYTLSQSSKYKLTGWIDSDIFPAGNNIRIIIGTEK